MVDKLSSQAGDKIKQAIATTRTEVNGTEKDMIQIVNQISSTMGNELELYRLLIFKEGEQYKSSPEDDQQQNAEYDDRQIESGDSEKSPALSIKVEEPAEQPQYSS